MRVSVGNMFFVRKIWGPLVGQITVVCSSWSLSASPNHVFWIVFLDSGSRSIRAQLGGDRGVGGGGGVDM